MADTLARPPLPTTEADRERVNHSFTRRQLLYSRHESLVTALLYRRLGKERVEAMGAPDLSANPYLQVHQQIAVLYDDEPGVRAPSASEALVSGLAEIGYWPLMQRVQRDTLGLREMGMRLDVDPDSGTLDPRAGRVVPRPVFPDLIESVIVNPRAPHTPLGLREWVLGARGWERHETDISDPDAPTYRITDADGKDITGDVIRSAPAGGYVGEAYPWRWTSGPLAGRPRLPYVLYHAARTGHVFDPYAYREVVDGSLILCVHLTMYGHVLQNAAWTQRYAFGIDVDGTRIVGTEGNQRAEAVVDPAVVVTGSPREGMTSPIVGQWSPPMDPEAMLRSIAAYERRLLMLLNVQAADVTRQEADVRSGYSLAVSRESVRAVQRVFMPQFRAGDQELFSLAASMCNGQWGTSYAEDPALYRISYQGLPATPDEEERAAKAIEAEVAAGRLGPVTAYRRRYPGATEEEAIEALVEAQVEREAVDALVAARRASLGLRGPSTNTRAVGDVQAIADIVGRAGRGEIPVGAARAMLQSVCGISPQDADAITAGVVPPTPGT